ncbi:MAG: alanine racemase [Candidatus Zixiibacteriota bacterium]|nr:MAG: alanine racemase [candidate division Zixibacteria bacterium]
MMSEKKLLSWIELSRSALSKNIAALRGLTNGKLIAVSVKANAYGHGLSQVVRLLTDDPSVDYVTVHSLEEAEQCRGAGWNKPIMVLGPIPVSLAAAVLELDLEPVIFNRQFLDRLGKIAAKSDRQVKTHLKLETGTHRQGITEVDLPAFAETYRKYESLKRPYGASMHFANIEDTTNHEYAEFQLKNFRSLLAVMNALKIRPDIRHTASSAAAILFKKTHFEMIRPGIAVYGHWPSKETYLSYRLKGGQNDLFTPVLSWKTRITQLKQLPPDSFVGYGCTYRTTAATRLAVLPIGYCDGYGRSLSNRAYVLISDRRAPVRGRVCMNLTMVDTTDIKKVKLEDVATIIGRGNGESISVEQIADWSGTINYEVLARLSSLTTRLIVP